MAVASFLKESSRCLSLIQAAGNGAVEDVQLFLRNKSPVNLVDWAGRSALHYAEAVSRVLLDGGASTELADLQGLYPIHHAAAYGGINIMKNLLSREEVSQQVNSRSNKGTTPLHCAAAHGNLGTTIMLLAEGADANVSDTRGLTPEDYANRAGQSDVARVLRNSRKASN